MTGIVFMTGVIFRFWWMVNCRCWLLAWLHDAEVQRWLSLYKCGPWTLAFSLTPYLKYRKCQKDCRK